MLRLRSGGLTILNCLNLYKWADIHDLLAQPEAFRRFVYAHCRFGVKEQLLVKALFTMDGAAMELAEDGDPQLANLDKVLEVKYLPDKDKEEIQNYREGVRSIAAQQKEGDPQLALDRVTIVGLLSRISIERLSEQLKNQNSDPAATAGSEKAAAGGHAEDILGEANAAEGAMASAGETAGGGVSFGEESDIHLSGAKYQLAFNDALKLEDGQTIRTYCLLGDRPAGVSIAFVKPGEAAPREEIINRGECLFVNVVDQTVVCLLPREIRKGNTVLKRGPRRELVMNGKWILTEMATAFAMNEAGDVIWVKKDGHPDGNLNDAKIVTSHDIVEVALRGANYYLLRSTGAVISNDARANVQTCVVSLSNCIGGEQS